MATESYLEVPADSTGKRIRHRELSRGGAEVVYEPYVLQAEDPTWYAWSGTSVNAANKQFLSILNTAAQVIRVEALYLVSGALTAITGVGLQFDIKRITAITGGSAVTPQAMDSADTALSGVTCVTNPTSTTEGAVLYPWYATNDEAGITNTPAAGQQNRLNMMPELAGRPVKPLVLRQNEGVTVKQITSNALAGSLMGVLAVFTKEP